MRRECDPICVVGRFPPPLGGVSVYCARRYAELQTQSDGTRKIDFSDPRWPLQLLLSRNVEYEVNTLNLAFMLIHFLLGKMSRSVVIDHNASRDYRGWRKALLLRMLAQAREIRVVNEALKEFYPPAQQTNVVVPFVPPDANERDAIFETYPRDVRDFIDREVFFVNSAWRYAAHRDTDLYGLEDSVRLLERLPDIRVLIAVGDGEALPGALRDSVSRYVETGRLCVLKGQKELWPVFTKCAICLRLTPLDGDSVTIREALYFDCPVLASDAVSRPEGCTLYRYGDFDDLEAKARKILKGYPIND